MSTRYVRPALRVFAVLLFWMAWPVGQANAVSNGLAGSSGCVDDTWTAISREGAPPNGLAVWTGTEMLVWGGGRASGRYDPATDTWAPISTVGQPSIRDYYTAVWTGTEMIVWGGDGYNHELNTGGRYDPATDIWTPTSALNAPHPRQLHWAVWTGTEMIVWGGIFDDSIYFTDLDDGGRYDPTTDTWTALSRVGAPCGAPAVWTGTEMLVWGGQDLYALCDGGSRYNPATDTWAPISSVGAPSARVAHTAVWTGSEMIIWGGSEYRGLVNTGGRYDPATDTWAATSTAGAPNARVYNSAVWTGTQMIVWGGREYPSFVEFNTGGRYDPTSDTWTVTSITGAPSARAFHTAVWTGTEMLVWGGGGGGGRYCVSPR